jgi:hypothetical protein
LSSVLRAFPISFRCCIVFFFLFSIHIIISRLIWSSLGMARLTATTTDHLLKCVRVLACDGAKGI